MAPKIKKIQRKLHISKIFLSTLLSISNVGLSLFQKIILSSAFERLDYVLFYVFELDRSYELLRFNLWSEDLFFNLAYLFDYKTVVLGASV